MKQTVFRNQTSVGQIRARTEKFRTSFYSSCLFEWNKLDHVVRTSTSVSIFKKNIFSQIRPANSVCCIHNPKGIAYLTQLRVGLSKHNFHKFRHNFKDTINPMCPINDDIEDTEHFLLLCSSSQSIDAVFSLVLTMCSKCTDIPKLRVVTFYNFYYTEMKTCLWKQML